MNVQPGFVSMPGPSAGFLWTLALFAHLDLLVHLALMAYSNRKRGGGSHHFTRAQTCASVIIFFIFSKFF
jgi:hypothetical protein